MNKLIEKNIAKGIFEIYINGNLHQRINNRLMNTVLTQMINSFLGNNPDLAIKYIALGTGNNAITDTDTQLQTEIFRTPFATRASSAYNEITTEFSVLSTEANAQIEEIGLFGGASASGSADSGTLISRILWSHLKTSVEEIAIKRIDKIERG